MEEILEQFNAWFSSQISYSEAQQKILLADDRADEAALEKIRANVFDIFRTILSVAVKTGKGNSDAVRRFFLLKAEQIPESWAVSYNCAKRHDDAEKMYIESIKLDTIREIKIKFSELWEGIT